MPVKVTDYMTRKVISIAPEQGIREAFFIMKEHSIRHLPVLNAEQELIGIISDRELRRPNWVDEAHDIAHVYILDDAMQVSDVMIRNVHVLHTYDTLLKATQLLLEKNIGAVPVLDKNDKLVGMLSAVDLLRAFSDSLADQRERG